MNRLLVRFALLSAGILSIGIMASATQASVFVRFDLNYSASGSNGLIDYFEVELFDDDAFYTVDNFLQYVENGLYDNTIIHRNAKKSDGTDFIVQGGGFTPQVEDGVVTDLVPITSYGEIPNEFSPDRSNVRGTIAMAKRPDDPHSATNQWFVNLGDNSANLDYQNDGFTVFGQVLGEGMALIDAINSLPTEDLSQYFGSTAFTDVPLFNDGTFVTVISATVVSDPSEPSEPSEQPSASSSGSLSGFAYVDTNHNGGMDGDDYAIADARVSLVQAGSNTPLATVYSASDGSYHFNNLGAGTFSIKMETPSYLPGQDNGSGQIVLDKDGTIISVGTAGTALQNAFSDISLGDGQMGTNFNIAQAAYPVALISVRMLLNSSTGIPHTSGVAVSDTNTDDDSILDFDNVLVGTPGNATLTVTNLGSQGSVLSGEFPGASGEFGTADTSTFGPLDSGQEASREYTYTPNARGASTQDIIVASNIGNMMFTLSGTGVAPMSSLTQSDTGYALVGHTATASVTVENLGDGNLSDLGEISNLSGTISAGSGNFSGPGDDFSVADNDSQTFDYTYTIAQREETVSTTISVDFANGSEDGTNSPHTQDITISGTGVAPIQEVDASAADAGLVRIGTAGPASFIVKNVGDGNLSLAGEASNLIGSVDSSSGSFIGDGGSFSLLDDTTQTFGFTYMPTYHDADSTTIPIQFDNGSTDGANLPDTVNAELSGWGVGPVFYSDLAPGSILDLGGLPQGGLMSFPLLEVSNDSTDPNDGDEALTDLTLIYAEITGTDSELFSIVGFSDGAVVHQLDSLSLEIEYNGGGEHGEVSAMLTIFTDEGAALGVSGNFFEYQIIATLAPEPGSLVLLAAGGLFLGGLTWRRWAIRIG